MKIPVYCAQYGTFVAMADVDSDSEAMLRERAYWANKINIAVPAKIMFENDDKDQSTLPRHAEVGVVKFRLPTGHSISVGLTHDRGLLAGR